jgi:hypothetical protein
MRSMETTYGAGATYYFRLCTLNDVVITSLKESGADIAYHSEELATMIKATGVRERQDVLDLIPAAKELALFNLKRFRQRVGVDVRHVSSHGDFANGQAGVTNSVLYDDDLRTRPDSISKHMTKKSCRSSTSECLMLLIPW